MQKGISLHLGLNFVDSNHYGGWDGTLYACENDAQDMFSIARTNGYIESTVLLSRNATRANFIYKTKEIASKLETGDIFFLSYSGHGGKLPDWSGDEWDHQDETWCLYDGQLIDDELSALWTLFKPGVRILVVSDSCHSGTITRDINSKEESYIVYNNENKIYRAMPNEIATRTFRNNKDYYEGLFNSLKENIKEEVIEKSPKAFQENATVILLSGCQDNQLSMDGSFNGLFTGNLLRVWDNGRFMGNYYQFYKYILMRMPSTQSPNYFVTGAYNPNFELQRPFQI